MKTIGSTIIMLALASSLFADNGKELKLASPDGTHEIVFYQKQVSPAVNELCYRVDYKSQPVVNESRAGTGQPDMGNGSGSTKPETACLLDGQSGSGLRDLPARNKPHLAAALR